MSFWLGYCYVFAFLDDVYQLKIGIRCVIICLVLGFYLGMWFVIIDVDSYLVSSINFYWTEEYETITSQNKGHFKDSTFNLIINRMYKNNGILDSIWTQNVTDVNVHTHGYWNDDTFYGLSCVIFWLRLCKILHEKFNSQASLLGWLFIRVITVNYVFFSI